MKDNKDQIGDRMKRYELVSDFKLIPKSKVIIRIDGKSFHTFTRKMQKPFDMKFIEAMIEAGKKTAKEMMGFKLGYHQSDEFNFLIDDLNSFETQGWFNYELRKIVSISASYFTAFFNKLMDGTEAVFDARAFNIPEDEAANIFIWRQRDWERNSLQMFARSFFSSNELHLKGKSAIHEMLYEKGENWTELSNILKNGTFITKEGQEINKKMNYQEIQTLIFNP